MNKKTFRKEVKQELNRSLTSKLLGLFEKKTKGGRKTDRQYAQVLEARDQLTRKRNK